MDGSNGNEPGAVIPSCSELYAELRDAVERDVSAAKIERALFGGNTASMLRSFSTEWAQRCQRAEAKAEAARAVQVEAWSRFEAERARAVTAEADLATARREAEHERSRVKLSLVYPNWPTVFSWESAPPSEKEET